MFNSRQSIKNILNYIKNDLNKSSKKNVMSKSSPIYNGHFILCLLSIFTNFYENTLRVNSRHEEESYRQLEHEERDGYLKVDMVRSKSDKQLITC